MTMLRGLLAQRSTSFAGRALTITGVLSATLAGATSNTTGVLTCTGTLAATLANCTSNTSGAIEAATTGTFVATLDNITSVMTGSVAVAEESEVELPTMSRISDILVRARDTLADPRKERWSDERLLRLLDEAQSDLAKHSSILKGSYEFSLSIGEYNYTLPDDVWLITRATYDNKDIQLLSYDKLDEQLDWDLVEGNAIEALVFDNRNVNQIRTYPIPNADIADAAYAFQNSGYLEVTTTEFDSPFGLLTDVPSTDSLLDEFGVVTEAESILYLITDPNSCNGASVVDDIDFSSVFGVTTDVEDNLRTVGFHGDELLGVVVDIDDYSIDSVYGVTASLYDPNIKTEVMDSPYGIVTSVSESQKSIKIWYVKLPDKLTSMNSTLQTPPMFDTALKHYVVGHALRDDIDVQYREMGAESIALYERELAIATRTNASDSTRRAANYTATYRGGFNQ